MLEAHIIKKRVIDPQQPDPGTTAFLLPCIPSCMNVFNWMHARKLNTDRRRFHMTMLYTAKTMRNLHDLEFQPYIYVRKEETRLSLFDYKNGLKGLVLNINNATINQMFLELHQKANVAIQFSPHVTLSYKLPRNFVLRERNLGFDIKFWRREIQGYKYSDR